MAPRDYTILGDWATTPPGLLVMLPGGLLASTSDGLPLGLGLSGPGCHPCNSGDGEWVEHCERSTWQGEFFFILHSYCFHSHLFFYIWWTVLEPDGGQGVHRPSTRLGDALAAHPSFVLCTPA